MRRRTVQLDELPPDLAELLRALVPGTYVSVPSDGPTKAEARAQEVVRLRGEGMKIREIARRVELTERRVLVLLSQAKRKADQVVIGTDPDSLSVNAI